MMMIQPECGFWCWIEDDGKPLLEFEGFLYEILAKEFRACMDVILLRRGQLFWKVWAEGLPHIITHCVCMGLDLDVLLKATGNDIME